MIGKIAYISELPTRGETKLFAQLPDVLSVPQIANDVLHVSESTVRREIQRGALKCFHAGTRVLVTKTALLEYVSEEGDHA